MQLPTVRFSHVFLVMVESAVVMLILLGGDRKVGGHISGILLFGVCVRVCVCLCECVCVCVGGGVC